jgi:hypothetical protein
MPEIFVEAKTGVFLFPAPRAIPQGEAGAASGWPKNSWGESRGFLGATELDRVAVSF